MKASSRGHAGVRSLHDHFTAVPSTHHLFPRVGHHVTPHALVCVCVCVRVLCFLCDGENVGREEVREGENSIHDR